MRKLVHYIINEYQARCSESVHKGKMYVYDWSVIQQHEKCIKEIHWSLKSHVKI